MSKKQPRVPIAAVLHERDLLEITPPRIERPFDVSMWGDEYHYALPPLRMSEMEITTTKDLRPALERGEIVAIKAYGMTICGYVTYITMHTDLLGFSGDPNSQVVVTYKVKIRPTGRPVYDSETQQPDAKEPLVKIYEAVIVKLDPQTQEPAEVVKTVPAFVAKSDRAAQDQVLVDYAAEAHISGKDLAGYSVRVRSFQAV